MSDHSEASSLKRSREQDGEWPFRGLLLHPFGHVRVDARKEREVALPWEYFAGRDFQVYLILSAHLPILGVLDTVRI